MRVQATSIAVLLTVLPGSLAHAQQLVQGALLRGTSADQRFGGRLAWFTPDSLAVVQDVDTTVHARSRVQALEIAAGTRRHPWTGTAIGAGIGAVAGLAIIIAADDNRDSELEGLEVGVAGALTLAGAAAGGLAGALIKTRRWIRVHPAKLGVSIAF
jgi:hypothetical protein